ncbi:MAG: hypothetical protein MZV65_00905 [Chromatiales bacterium]|nr:hypothetical protein [Chromatiales bacterium]
MSMLLNPDNGRWVGGDYANRQWQCSYAGVGTAADEALVMIRRGVFSAWRMTVNGEPVAGLDGTYGGPRRASSPPRLPARPARRMAGDPRRRARR